MDPLSVAASIGGLIALVDLIAKSSYSYVGKVKDAPEEWKQIQQGILALRLVLSVLESQVQKFHSTGTNDSKPSAIAALGLTATTPNQTTSNTTTSRPVLIDATKTLLEKISNDITKWERSPRAQRLMWPFNSGRAQEYLASLENCKSSFNLAVDVDNYSAVRECFQNTIRIEDGVRDIIAEQAKLRLEKQAEIKEQENYRLLNWLSPLKPKNKLNSSQKLHEPGTGQWLLDSDSFQDFWERKEPILWLCGKVGTGKTILSSTIIKDMTHRSSLGNDSIAIIYAFCEFSDQATLDPINIFGSFAKQLYLILPGTEMHASLKSLYTKDRNEKTGEAEKPTMEGLSDTISSLSDEFDHVYVAIDALDEYPFEIRDDFLTNLLSLQQKTVNLSILISSRPENDIRNSLSCYPQISTDNSSVTDDITTYVKSEVQHKRKRLAKLDESKQQDIIRKLVNKSDKMFRWVQCQLDIIDKARTVKAMQTALDNLPKGLFGTYDRILESIEDDDKEIARRVLTWLSYSHRPLAISELLEAIAVNESDDEWDDLKENLLSEPDDVLEICGSLVSQLKPGILGLAHFSVKEYLHHEYTAKELPYFSLTPTKAHDELASVCLTYLTFDNFRLYDPSIQKDRSSSNKAHPLAFERYARKNWDAHYRSGSQQLIGRWFKKIFPQPQKRIRLPPPKDRLAVEIPYDLGILRGGYYRTYFSYAIYSGYFRMTQHLLEMAIDYNFEAYDYDYALRDAVAINDTRITSLLLDAGADPCYITRALIAIQRPGQHVEISESILDSAIKHRYPDIVSLLLDGRATIDKRTLYEALKCAASFGAKDMFRLLRENGAPTTDNGEEGVLASAARGGDLEFVRMLLDAGADPNSPPGSSLEAAVESGEPEILNLLVERGARVHEGDKGRKSLFYVAAKSRWCINSWYIFHTGPDLDTDDEEIPHKYTVDGYNEFIDILINLGADINLIEDGKTPLEHAVNCDNETWFLLLAKKGADFNQIQNPQRILECAIGHGMIDTVRMLLDRCRGIDINGMSLDQEQIFGNVDLTNLLLQHGAKMDPVAWEKQHFDLSSLLLKAVTDKNLEDTEALLAKGADPCFDNNASLRSAVQDGSQDLVRILFRNADQLAHARFVWYTPGLLHLFVEWGDEYLVSRVLEIPSNVDINERRSKESPLEIASKHGHQSIVRLLLENGADPTL
ncbi:hypothetical protein TWF696_003963 [Orbilia brochopaga]|uniref:NACHT domain-containing protein n=1 Tax=Orbilia brochopaga TaxID=3140254 RepID=A0AAV9V4U6_9PEZI